jgi:hypothetical protein
MTHQNEALSFEQFHSSHAGSSKKQKDEDRLLLLRGSKASLSHSPSNFALIKNARTHGRCAKTERCTPAVFVLFIYFLGFIVAWLGLGRDSAAPETALRRKYFAKHVHYVDCKIVTTRSS